MRFKKGDKVALFCLSGMRGFDYLVYVGVLQSIKTGTGPDHKTVTIHAARAYLPQETKDMKDREVSVSTQAFTLRPWDQSARDLIKDSKDVFIRSQYLLARLAQR